MTSVLIAASSIVTAFVALTAQTSPAPEKATPRQVQAPIKHVASAETLMRMANAMADLRRFDEAITAYGLALEQEPENGEILANRALSYAWINRVDEATQDLKRAEQLLPDVAVLHRIRAIIANRRSDEDTELAELTRSLQQEPANPFALSFRASIYQRRHLYQAAIADADAYIRSKPDEPEAYQMKAELLGRQRKWPEALREARLLEQRFPNESRAAASAAQIYSKGGDRAAALAAIGRALQLDEGLFYFWQLRSQIRRWDDFDGRETDLETALKLAPGDLNIVARLGMLAFARGRWTDARARFTEVLEKEPRDFGILTYRAMAFAKSGDKAGALRDYKSAIAVAAGPGDFSLICRLLAEEDVALDWALASCDKALATKPEKTAYLVNRGIVRLRMGDAKGASSDFDRAIGSDPNNAEAFYGRAIARRRSGSPLNAADDRQTALVIDPTVEDDFCADGMCELKPPVDLTKHEGEPA